ncbi:MAG: CYTH domain-containing protein [Firmicutes bacterium]|nr:CYTH domain-containing protein [Bacillota bacterium]
MEIELKYNIPDAATADEIWDNELFKDYEEDGSREETFLAAKYFDTEDYDLSRNEIAYRVRKEGEHTVAALKWKGHSEDGLHVREEINVPVHSEEPDPSVFKESKIGSQVMEFVGDSRLHSILETLVNRRNLRIDTGEGIFEMSVDEGSIVTEYGEVPIREVELELYSGDTEELIKVGSLLRDKYNLTEEDESKYSRGMKLIEANR